MRGAERPAKVQWTRPFLQPLKPLAQSAARQTFIDIADATKDPEEVDRVLSLQLFAVQQARSVFFCFGKFSREQLP
jgi:hypothetical protein